MVEEKSNSKIAIVFPTRNRPEKLTRFVESARKMAEDPSNLHFYLYVDSDDRLTIPSITTLADKYPAQISCLVGPRIMHSQTANMLIPYVKEDIFYLGADDLIIRTKGWDKVIIKYFEEHEDKVVMAYGDDLFQKELATHPIIHRKWVEAVGYLTPPYFESDFADTWLNDLAQKLGRKQKLKFTNEHMHHFAGKSEVDSTLVESRNRYNRQDPTLVYQCLEPVRQRDAGRLKKVIKELNSND